MARREAWIIGTGLIASKLESHTSVPGIEWLNAKAEHLQRTGADEALSDFLFDIGSI